MQIREFFEADKRNQSLIFPILKRELESFVKRVLWTEFKKVDQTLVNECLSFLFEKLISCYKTIETGKEKSFVYTMTKSFFRDWFFGKSAKTVFVEDILIYNHRSDIGQNEFNDLKIEVVDGLKKLLKEVTDKNSLQVLSTLIELIIESNNYNSQYISLYLYRKTDLKFEMIFKVLKSLRIKLPLSTEKYFDRIFRMYSDIVPEYPSIGIAIISEWERSAITHFENHHVRSRGLNFDARHFRPMERERIKSTGQERIRWFLDNLSNEHLERDYYERFNMSYRTFKEDKRKVNNLK
ncbi:hypothetical protein WSM22_03300 [Cytophagales bacterium WSM2-2]|nr:hypothetical protein WSM22_03300 [Cytophagales bacterium WSM2-2]